jgi:endonuclease YncB( thermonuclease family)
MGEAKELLAQLLLSEPIEILVKPRWHTAAKKSTEITGVVFLEKSKAGVHDVGLLLLSKGLAKFHEPQPYSMSRYTECQYKHAESEAKAKKLGIWATRAPPVPKLPINAVAFGPTICKYTCIWYTGASG